MGQLSQTTFASHMAGRLETENKDTEGAIIKAAGEYCQPKNFVSDNGKSIYVCSDVKVTRHGEQIKIPTVQQKMDNFSKSVRDENGNFSISKFATVAFSYLGNQVAKKFWSDIDKLTLGGVSRYKEAQRQEQVKDIYNSVSNDIRGAVNEACDKYVISKDERFDNIKISSKLDENGGVKYSFLVKDPETSEITRVSFHATVFEDKGAAISAINANIINTDKKIENNNQDKAQLGKEVDQLSTKLGEAMGRKEELGEKLDDISEKLSNSVDPKIIAFIQDIKNGNFKDVAEFKEARNEIKSIDEFYKTEEYKEIKETGYEYVKTDIQENHLTHRLAVSYVYKENADEVSEKLQQEKDDLEAKKRSIA